MTLRVGRIGLFAGAALGCLLMATASEAASHKRHASHTAASAGNAAADQARDERIEHLEAAVEALQSKVQDQAALEQQNTELKGQVGDLQAQVSDLKFADQTQIQELRHNADVAPKLTLPNGRPAFATADGAFTATLHGVMQFDAAQYDQKGVGATSKDFRRSGPALGASGSNVDLTRARDLKAGDLFRRARIGLDGTVFKDWDYRILFDFAGAGVENTGQLYETWVQYSGLKPLHFRVGAFSPSIGLDDQASTNGMPFLERAASSDLARGLAAGDTRTAVAAFANGDHWLISAAVTGRTIGVINTGTVPTTSCTSPTPPTITCTTSAIGTAQSYSDQLGFVGRFAATPLYGDDWRIHLGVHGSYVARPPTGSGPSTAGVLATNARVIALSNTPELRVDGTKLINTGNIDAKSAYTAGAEFAAQKQNLLVQGEYDRFGVERNDPGLSSPTFEGWYVSGSWMLTGEARVYNAGTAAFDAPTVAHPFSLSKGGLGAFELVARYSDMDLNYHAGSAGNAPTADAIRGGEETNISVGLNWYANQVVRFMADFQHVHLNRLSPCGGPNSFTSGSCSSSLWSTPIGAQIGQTYDVFAVRSQVAF